MQRVSAAALVLALFSVLGACNDGTPTITSTAPLTAFSATWEGTMRSGAGVLSRLGFTIEPNGLIAGVMQNGIDQQVTGSFSRVNDQVFQGTFGGTSFFMMMTPDAEYAILVTEDFDFAVLQRVSPPFPSQFAAQVVEERWAGQGFTLTGSFGFGQMLDSSVRVRIASREFEGGDSDGYVYMGTSPLDVLDAGFGVFDATFETSPAGAAGDLVALVSADGDFAAVMTCEAPFVDPPMLPPGFTACRFRGLKREE